MPPALAGLLGLAGVWADFPWNGSTLRVSFRAGEPAPERILVVRLDRIGDNVLNSAFLREFRAQFPRAKITLVVRPVVKNLVELCPYVDEVRSFWPYDRWCWRYLPRLPQLLGYAAQALWPRRFDLAVNPRWDGDYNQATKLMFLSRASRRMAFSENLSASRKRRNCGYDLLLTDPIAARFRGHDLQRSLGLIRHLGRPIGSEAAEVWLDQGDRNRAAEMLGENDRPSEQRLLSVGIGASGPRRIWPRERFIALLRPYASLPGCRIAILGGPAERPRPRPSLRPWGRTRSIWPGAPACGRRRPSWSGRASSLTPTAAPCTWRRHGGAR